MSEQSNPKKSKNIFSSHFTFTILSKLSQGYRPSQIATQLGVTPQDIYYHTDRMIDAGLIFKDTSNGIKWTLTDKGKFILKQKLTGSVNSFNNYQTARVIPTRLDNLSFAFKVFNFIPEDPHLHWTEIKNGVSKCALKYDTHTIELVKSEKQGTDSALLVHMNEKYCFDWYRELIKEYNLAIRYAKQSAIKFSLQISDDGYPIKRPHIAFEHDLIASSLAASYTSQIRTREGNDEYTAWTDSSNGSGELETNDDEYAYNYLMMPRTIKEIADTITMVRKQTVGYEKHHHPILTMNN
jgi:DNA-binding MarR family transcriptional regulator